MRASVVIPTYNRLSDLRKVVASLERQTVPDRGSLEIVVVDDGSTDGTGAWLAEHGDGSHFIVHRQANSGPATARNNGVERASGEIILFLGDDTDPQPDWLLTHLEEHRLFGGEGPLAVLGYTSFPTDLESPFLRHINEWGAQFGYLLIEDPRDVPFNFFYTSNISLPREDFERLGGFREDFPAAAWEDIEFAYRASSHGLTLRYQPRARTIHRHRILPRTFCRRQRTSGLSAALFADHHPELRSFLGVEKLRGRRRFQRVRRALLWMAVECGEIVDGIVPTAVYTRFLDSCYLDGLAEGLHSSDDGR